MEKIKFWLDGCDIQFLAEAPEDITLKQLLKQCNRIKPHWCACGINSKNIEDFHKVEIIIDYDDVKKVDDDVSCDILENKEEWNIKRLYELPENQNVKLYFENEVVIFGHLDGLYSYCWLEEDKNKIVHIKVTTEFKKYKDGYKYVENKGE